MPFRPDAFQIILALSILNFGKVALAQKALPYESILTAQGLSQGMVFDLLQDQEGFTWAATKKGLNR